MNGDSAETVITVIHLITSEQLGLDFNSVFLNILTFSYTREKAIKAHTIQLVFSFLSVHLPVPCVHLSALQLVHHCEDWRSLFLSIRRFYSTWLESFRNSAADSKTEWLWLLSLYLSIQFNYTTIDGGGLAGATSEANSPHKYHFTFPRSELSVS